ncbi:MFS transporter [Longispora sp. K20-0274]|uniref:MFS transporter n=1 Tax=Longispora sp. K20-0274 TaxID=3088255 RepID=UPI00399BF6E4
MSGTVEQAGPWVTFRELSGTVRLAMLGVFVNQFGFFLQAFLVLYLTHRGFSEQKALYAMAAYGLGAVIGLLFGGQLTDRVSPRTTIILSMAATTVLPLTITFMSSYPAIVAVVVPAGIMAQLYRPAASAILAALVPPARHVMAFSMNRIAMNLGVVFGPLAAGLLIAANLWDQLFWVTSVTSAIYALIAVFFLPKGRLGEESAAKGGEAATERRSLLRDGRYIVFLFAVLANALVYVQSYALLPLTLKDRGHSDQLFSLILTASALVLISCELLITKITQYWQARFAAAAGLALLGIGMAAYGLPIGGLVVVFTGAAVVVFGQIIGGPSIFAYPAKVAPPGTVGRYMGGFFAAFGLGQALGPMLVAPAHQWFGESIWFAIGGLSLIAGLAALVGMRGAAVPPPTPDDASTEPADSAPATA